MGLKKINISIFASGNGSNFENLVQFLALNTLPLNLVFLFCDNPQAFVLERAKKLNIEYMVLPKKKLSTLEHENKILEYCRQFEIEWILLAGYRRILSPSFVYYFPNKIINIHPSILPAFQGLNAIENAWNYGVKISGVTTHFVNEGVDSGAIIAQKAVSINAYDSLESFTTKIHLAEFELYPKTLQILFSK